MDWAHLTASDLGDCVESTIYKFEQSNSFLFQSFCLWVHVSDSCSTLGRAQQHGSSRDNLAASGSLMKSRDTNGLYRGLQNRFRTLSEPNSANAWTIIHFIKSSASLS